MGYRITTVGKGEKEPRVPNTSEKNRGLNRRVEIRYTAKRAG
jgi:outer membrane protein OmpA-like peptidoglycan-associated protein